jgi:singapore isolate B (sub-type 7) whole genome shotgun sequence assembly, scaffold_2
MLCFFKTRSFIFWVDGLLQEGVSAIYVGCGQTDYERSPVEKVMRVNSAAVVVPAGSMFQLPVMIPKAGTRVRWSFCVKDYDCLFGIASRPNQFADDYVMKKQLIAPNVDAKGSIVVTDQGMIYLVWDNSYSWIRSKTVVYSLTVEIPSDGIEDKQKGSLWDATVTAYR